MMGASRSLVLKPAQQTARGGGATARARAVTPIQRMQQTAGNRATLASLSPEVEAHSTLFAQRRCACGGSCGSCSAPDDSDRSTIQPKLAVNEPGDAFEIEADRIAARLTAPVAAPAATPAAAAPGTAASALQRQENAESATSTEEEDTAEPFSPVVQLRAQTASAGISASSGVEQRILNQRGHGTPLPPSVRSRMEAHIGADFRDVRIHANSEAHSLNNALQAYAFTSGRDIFFSSGQYDPASPAGAQLLAHELVHVVQQGGAPAPVRRAPKKKLGDWAHDHIQTELLTAMPNLITEAPIPGETGSTVAGAPDLTKMGFADLFVSSSNTFAGIRGRKKEGAGDVVKGDPPLVYSNITADDTAKHPTAGKGTAAPTLSGGSLSGDFPAEFWVGEIKPLIYDGFGLRERIAEFGVGKGVIQVDNYLRGLKAFTDRAATDFGSTASSGDKLDVAGKLPAGLDYANYDSEMQATTPGAGAKFKPDGSQRLWAYVTGKGSIVYFLLPPRTTILPAYRANLEKTLKQLEDKIPKRNAVPTVLTPVSKKAKPGTRAAVTVVQRTPKTPALARNLADPKWEGNWKAFEAERSAWSSEATTKEVTGTSDQNRDFRRQVGIDKKLGFTPASVAPVQKAQGKVDLWAGASGYVYGWLRFKFAWLFEKFETLVAKLKEKSEKFRESAKPKFDKFRIDWKAAALDVIGTVLMEILREIVGKTFAIVTGCINGMIDVVVQKIEDEIREEFEEILAPWHDKYESLRAEIETRYAPIIEGYETALGALEDAQYIVNMLSSIEAAVRLLVQGLACATPPALGCLWGLVAQVGFSVAAGLAVKTHAFKKYIAEPSAKEIVDNLIADSLKSLMVDIFTAAGLGEIVEKADACNASPAMPEGKRIGNGQMYFPNTSGGFQEWAAEFQKNHGAQALKELQTLMTSGGTPATPADLQRLLDALKDKTPEEIKKLLDGAKKGGKVEINSITGAGGGGSGTGGGTSSGGAGSGTSKSVVVDASAQSPSAGGGKKTGWSIQVVVEEKHRDGKTHKDIRANLWNDRDEHVALINGIEGKFIREEVRNSKTYWYYEVVPKQLGSAFAGKEYGSPLWGVKK